MIAKIAACDPGGEASARHSRAAVYCMETITAAGQSEGGCWRLLKKRTSCVKHRASGIVANEWTCTLQVKGALLSDFRFPSLCINDLRWLMQVLRFKLGFFRLSNWKQAGAQVLYKCHKRSLVALSSTWTSFTFILVTHFCLYSTFKNSGSWPKELYSRGRGVYNTNVHD